MGMQQGRLKGRRQRIDLNVQLTCTGKPPSLTDTIQSSHHIFFVPFTAFKNKYMPDRYINNKVVSLIYLRSSTTTV